MRAATVAVTILFLVVWAAPSSPNLSIEVGGEAIVFGNVADADEFVDAAVVRVSAAEPLRAGVSFGPVLSWRYQRPAGEWQPMAPDGPVPDFWRSRGQDDRDAYVAFYEVTLRARALDCDGRLRPFTELEGGFALIDDGDKATGDAIVGLRVGAAWRPRSELALLLGIGQRLYLSTERFTLPITLDLVVGF